MTSLKLGCIEQTCSSPRASCTAATNYVSRPKRGAVSARSHAMLGRPPVRRGTSKFGRRPDVQQRGSLLTLESRGKAQAPPAHHDGLCWGCMEAHSLLASYSLGTNRYGPDLNPPSVQVWTATHGACDLLSRNPPVLNWASRGVAPKLGRPVVEVYGGSLFCQNVRVLCS